MHPTSRKSSRSDRPLREAPAAAGLVGRLLADAAGGVPLAAPDLADPRGGQHQGLPYELRWALRGGLGPALLAAAQRASIALPADWSEPLLSADLTARHRHAGFVDATVELLDICAGLGVPVTLLKGISTSEQLYAEAHQRPMVDVDVLIAAEDYARTEAALLRSGFARSAEPEIAGLQHGVPLLHGPERTVVEIHTGLFRSDSLLQAGSLFQPSTLEQRTCETRFHRRPARRMLTEMQMAYAAASWVNDLVNVGLQTSFMASLFDIAHLLRRHGEAIDWNRMLEWVDNEMARASLYLALSYLQRFGAQHVPALALKRLASGQRLLGALQLPLMHHVLDRHLLAGRPWRWPLPPPLPARYALRHQLEKRIMGPLRRADRVKRTLR